MAALLKRIGLLCGIMI